MAAKKRPKARRRVSTPGKDFRLSDSPIVEAEIKKVVSTQIQIGDPPETRETYERLLAEGISEKEAKRLIGCVLQAELAAILATEVAFNPERYGAALSLLPEMPWAE